MIQPTDNLTLSIGPRSRMTVAAALENWLTYNGEIEGVETLADHEIKALIDLMLGNTEDETVGAPLTVRPVVVIVRHAETENEVSTYSGVGLPLIIDLDLGDSFDITHPTDAETGEVDDWLASVEQQRDALVPFDHPARAVIDDVIDRVREVFDEAPIDDE